MNAMAAAPKKKKLTPAQKHLSARLKTMRKKMGPDTKNTELAAKIGIEHRALLTYLYGERNPSKSVLRLIDMAEKSL